MIENFELIQSFGKGEIKEKKANSKNAIIYTRVSSKEQTENMSLDVQLKGCQNFAAKSGLQIKGIFGGTYESAQTDERNEFQRMVRFAKQSKEEICYIVVYSLERFSRTGENAIWLSRQLRELGITIFSVTQPIDTTNPAGVLQQNILFLFSQYDNDLRRQKCIDGMREKLLKGEWVGVAPMGYSYDRSGSSHEQKIIINKHGDLIKKAFELKVYGKLSHTQISEQITDAGLKLSVQRLCEMLRNPFYCGFLSHNLLKGKVVRGKHPAIVSEELFLEANDLLKKNAQGYKQKKSEDHVPLKQFIVCGECGTPFTGYIVKEKNLWYYKCNRIGCKCNKSARLLHSKFEELLSYYEFDKIYISPVIELMEEKFEMDSAGSKEQSKDLRTKLTKVNEHINTARKRYAIGEISSEVYDPTIQELNTEKQVLEKALAELQIYLSNPSKQIQSIVEKVANLKELWVFSDLQSKHDLQKLIFPKGIQYDRKIDHYRTLAVDEIVKLIDSFSTKLDTKRNDRSKNFIDLSPSVAPAVQVSNRRRSWKIVKCFIIWPNSLKFINLIIRS